MGIESVQASASSFLARLGEKLSDVRQNIGELMGMKVTHAAVANAPTVSLKFADALAKFAHVRKDNDDGLVVKQTVAKMSDEDIREALAPDTEIPANYSLIFKEADRRGI